MPTIVNPYRTPASPVAETIAKISGDLQRNALPAAINREKLRAEQRGNVETENLMRAMSTGSEVDWSVVAPALIGSGYDPQDFNKLNLGRSAGMYGARDPRTQAAQIGAGGAFSGTAEAFDTGQATTRRGQDMASADRRYGTDRAFDLGMYKFNNEPMEALVDGEVVFVPRGGAVGSGAMPYLKPNELGPDEVYRQYYDLATEQGMEDAAARRYALTQASRRSDGMKVTTSPDGSVTMESGGVGALGELTNNVTSNMQKQSIEAAQFNALADLAAEYLADPEKANLFGVTGNLRQKAQGTVEALNSAGMTVADVDTAKEDLAGSGLGRFLPELYDPELDAVDTVWGMIVYKGASALAGQEGRSVSDKDIVMFRNMLGDPKSFFSSQRSMAAKLDVARRIVSANQGVRDRAMAGQAPYSGDAVAVPTPAQAGKTAGTAIEFASEEEALQQPVGTFVRVNGQVFQVQP